MRAYDDVVCLPQGIASVQFEQMFGYPGKPKTWEYLLLCGPYGKYLLEGCMHPPIQKAVFEYLDLLGLMWQKSISQADLTKLETRVPIILAMLEDLLPAWELNMNRHQIVHLVEAIRVNGPCWAWAMFGFERMWKHLKDWMTQKSHPEATMFNAHAAFKAACLALPEVAQQLLADEQDLVWEGHSAQSANYAFSYTMQTFDRHTNQLILPSFLQANEHVAIELTDPTAQCALAWVNTQIGMVGGQSCTCTTFKSQSYARLAAAAPTTSNCGAALQTLKSAATSPRSDCQNC